MKKVVKQFWGTALALMLAVTSLNLDVYAFSEDLSNEEILIEDLSEESIPEDEIMLEDVTEAEDSQESSKEYYTVTYVALDEDVMGLPVDNTHYSYGDTVQVAETEPYRDGYEFWGWSLTGDPASIYTSEWSFQITEDVTFYATWTSEEIQAYNSLGTKRKKENGIVTAINNYVNSLNGTFNNKFSDGTISSAQCCAFCDYVWQGALGISRGSNPKVHKNITSSTKLKGSEIYEFLKSNDVQPGDWLWCHDPYYTEDKYKITHNMIILGYDSESITISDGYEVNGIGVVWHNNQRVSLTSGDFYNSYFKGNSYITVYKIVDESVHARFNPKSPKPYITSVEEYIHDETKSRFFTLTITAADGDNADAGDVYVKVWPTKEGESSVPSDWQTYSTYKASYYPDQKKYVYTFYAHDLKTATDFSYDVYLYDENGALAEKRDTAIISLCVPKKANGKCGDNLTWDLKESPQYQGYFSLTINGTGRMYDYDADLTPWEEQLREFGQRYSFKYTSITINPGITYIGNRAFDAVAELKLKNSFSIPDTVKEIGAMAFSGFPYSGALVIPDSVETIGTYAFNNSKFSSVTIGRGISLIPSNCFSGCTNLTYVKMSDNVKKIDSYAFENAGHGAGFKVEMSANVEEIGTESFYNCKTLQIDDLSFFKKLKKLDEHAFENCEQLSGELELSGDIKIARGFKNCKSLTKLTLNEGTTEIWYDAFRGCSGLKGTLVIPSSMHYINQRAFLGCSGLTGLKFPEEIASPDSGWNLRIGDRAFEGCSSLTGDIVLYSEVVYPYDAMRRSFYGCDKVSRFILAGGWTKWPMDEGGITKKGAIGQIEYDDEVPEGSVIATFPDNAKIFVDPSVFKDNDIRHIINLGYEVHSMDPGYYPVLDLNTFDITLLMTDNYGYNTTASSFLYPKFASDKDITITIKDPSIATIFKQSYDYSSWSGDTDLWFFRAKKIGDTTYTVTTSDGSLSKTGRLRVVKDDKSVTLVNINTYSLKLTKNETQTLTYDLLPSTATNKAVTWASSNPKVATVDSKGNVTGKAGGKCVITITTKDGGLTDTCDVTVEADNYTVSFDANGGEGEMPDMYCDPGQKYTLIANTFTKKGYVFDHWNTVSENDEYFYQTNTKYANKESFTDLGKAYDNITLYASWRPDQSYTIVYDSNNKASHGAVIYGTIEKDAGYAFNDEEDKAYVSDGDYLSKGVSFENWNTKADGTGLVVEPGDEYTPAQLGAKQLSKNGVQNVILYAQWKEDSYNIKFNLDGGVITDNTFGDSKVTEYIEGKEAKGLYTFGQAVKKLPVAQKKGYSFGGWFYDSTFKKAAKTLPANITSDTTLYAKWVPYKYTLILDANKNQGGNNFAVSGSAGKITASYGDNLPDLKNSFINKGYKLIGWTNENGSATAIVTSDEIITWEKVEALFGNIANNDKKTLYAVWEQTPYYISYELNMPEKSSAELDEICSTYIKSYEYGNPANTAIKLPVPERTGYIFEGWFTDSGLKKAKKGFTAIDFGDITLFAKWSAVYTVRLHDIDSESGNELAAKDYAGYKYAVAKTLPANPYTRTDAAFMGWSLSSANTDNTAAYANKQKISDPALTKTDNGFVLDLYAIWKKDFTVKIMTELNGVTYAKGEKNPLSSTESFGYTYTDVKKKAISLPKTLVKDGYSFTGWFTDEKGTQKITAISTKNCSDYELYAMFKPLSYQITYVANPPKGVTVFGKMPSKKAVYGDETAVDECGYYISGYTFGGWSFEPEATRIDVSENSIYTGKYQKNVKLYAVWFKR